MSNNLNKSISAGAHAGRGYRYQILYGVLLAIKSFVGISKFDKLIPEGKDDYEIHVKAGKIIINTKSSGLVSESRSITQDAKDVKKLWWAGSQETKEVYELQLVLNRGHNSYYSESGRVPISNTRLRNHKKLPVDHPNYEKTYVVIESDPIAEASSILVKNKQLLGFVADLICYMLIHKIGLIANQEDRDLDDLPLSLNNSDVSNIVNRVLMVCQIDKVESLLRKGFIKHVDFRPARVSASSYLDSDLRPGHILAGQIVQRPNETETIKNILESHLRCLVYGPSGSGKSGLIWQVVYATREEICWFEVTSQFELYDEDLISFINALSEEQSIGFVVDNVGSEKIGLFNQLIEKTNSNENVWVLGSIRTEDLSLILNSRSVPFFENKPDAVLAEQVFDHLKERNLTRVAHWVESWDASFGLIMEYMFLVAEGNTLQDTISKQVTRRFQNNTDISARRKDELTIVKAIMPVFALEGRVDLSEVRKALMFTDSRFAEALLGLKGEFLSLVEDSGELCGLHSLRSEAVCKAIVSSGYATRRELAENAMKFANSASIEMVTYKLIYLNFTNINTLASIVEDCFAGKLSNADIWIAIAQGAHRALLQKSVDEWCDKILKKSNFPPSTSIPVAFFVDENDVSSLPEELSIEATRLSTELLNRVDNIVLPSIVVKNLIELMENISIRRNAKILVAILKCLVGHRLQQEHTDLLLKIHIDFNGLDVQEVHDLLDLALSIMPYLYFTWRFAATSFDTITQSVHRIAEISDNVLDIEYKNSERKLIVQTKLDISNLAGQDREIARLLNSISRSILTLDPRVSEVMNTIVGTVADRFQGQDRVVLQRGEPTFATQTMSQRTRNAVAFRLGAVSWSSYLDNEARLLNELYDCAVSISNHRLYNMSMLNCDEYGRVPINNYLKQKMNTVIKEIEHLVPPADSTRRKDTSFCKLAPIHDLTVILNFTFPRYFGSLPASSSEFLAEIEELRENIDEIRQEPWHFLGKGPPIVLSKIEHYLDKFETIILESSKTGINPLERLHIPKKYEEKAVEYLSNYR